MLQNCEIYVRAFYLVNFNRQLQLILKLKLNSKQNNIVVEITFKTE